MAVLASFLVLLGALTWFQVIGADRYRSDPRNVRTSLNLAGKERGLILAADGTVLAQSILEPGATGTFTRIYPEGAAFAHVVGYQSRLAGGSGLESAYLDRLRSKSDLTISDLIAALLGRDLRPLSLQTSLDPAMQRLATTALSGQKGAAVAVDPATGDILAYVSAPSFDPQPLVGTDAVTYRQGLLDDPAGPIRDRVAGELYPPGSTFKTVVAAAALESGDFSPESPFADEATLALPGSSATISNFGVRTCAGGGEVTLLVAFARSCNTVFAKLAMAVGAKPIGAIAEALGFNDTIDLPWDVAPSVFPTDSLADDLPALAQSGIGQRDVKATALQMALVAATVANEGELVRPRLVTGVFDADGVAVESPGPETVRRALSPATADVLADMMEQVVSTGTGRAAAVSGVRVGGKTGTAERPGSAPDTWFMGFASVGERSMALAVLVEAGGDSGEDGTGGSVAAPIAADLIRAWAGL